MKCTLKDIAVALGCTSNTVSRALKEKDDISQKMIERVKVKAKELGYIPNVAASSLRSGKTNTIAIVFDNLLNPYYSIMTDIIENQLTKNGLSMMVFTDKNDEAQLSRRVTTKILSYNVDGIISFLQISQKAHVILKNTNVPCIVIGRDSSDDQIDSIFCDDENGGYIATKHLLSLGRKNILYFSLNEYISCSNLRFEGYKRALSEAGVAFDVSFVKMIGRDGWNGGELVETVMAQQLNFDAIFCVNDIIAYEAINCLEKYNISVPTDCAIIGYDNVCSHLKMARQITTIDTDKEQTAEIACEVLMHKITNRSKMHRLFTKINSSKLIEGIST